MRDLILKMTMSLDGFVSDLEGRNTWMFGGDQEAKAWSVETLRGGGLHIMGSRTFRAMAAYWPSATDAFAPPMNQIPKAVFSRLGPAILREMKTPVGPDETGGQSWANAEVASGELEEEIAKLKARDGKPIIAHGGVSFARSLVGRRLVDQFVLLVAPVALGEGRPLFSALAAPTPLKLISSRAFAGGAVAQVYRAT